MNKMKAISTINATNQVSEVLAESKGGDFAQLLGFPLEGLNEASETEAHTLHTARFSGGGGSLTSKALAQTWQAAGDVRGEVLTTHIGKAVGHHGKDGAMLGHSDEVVVAHHRLAYEKREKKRG